MSAAVLLRHVQDMQRDGDDLLLRVQRLREGELPGIPGWLTGESLAEQGGETTMPTLPDLELPELEGPVWLVPRSDDLVGRPWRLIVAGNSPAAGTTRLAGFGDEDVTVRWDSDRVRTDGPQPIEPRVRRL